MESSHLSPKDSCPCLDVVKTDIDTVSQNKEEVIEHISNGYIKQQNQQTSECLEMQSNEIEGKREHIAEQKCQSKREFNLATNKLDANLSLSQGQQSCDSNQTVSLSDGVLEQISSLDLSENIGLSVDIRYSGYKSELDMPPIMKLITSGLSEPYSIYTYRYFLHNWPHLSFLAWQGTNCIGAVVCKLDIHKKVIRRGYIAMLAVDNSIRCHGIGTSLVQLAIDAMRKDDCDEVVLETEITNKAALHLYENLGFVRDKRLFRYYLNGVDALRLKLWCK